MFNKQEQYEGGPDPLPWPSILRTMKNENLNWKQVAELFVGGEEADEEDASSDWSEGSSEEEEEDDDAEFDELVEEEEEEEVEEASEEDDTEEEEEEEEEEEDPNQLWESDGTWLGPMPDVSSKRKYDSDSTDETSPKKVKL